MCFYWLPFVHDAVIRSISNPIGSNPVAKPKSKGSSRKGSSRKNLSPSKCQVGVSSMYEVLNSNPQLRIFSQILQLSNTIPLFTDKSLRVTIFAPVDYAFGNLLMPGQGFYDLVPDQKIAEVLISYHTTNVPLVSRRLENGLVTPTKLAYKVIASKHPLGFLS